MRVSQFIFSDEQFLVISHRDITEQKLAEEEISRLSTADDTAVFPIR